MRSIKASGCLPLFFVVLAAPLGTRAQTAPGPASAATAVPRQSGTIKAATPQDFVLTNAAGQDFAVNVPVTARILLVDPVTRDIKTARVGTISDINGGDKAIVSGTAGDTGQTMTATRVLLLKSNAIAAMHADEQAAWAHSLGGVVRSADAAAGTLTVVNGQRSTTVTTSPSTIVRRYTGASVRFEDAVKSTVAAIQPGDQVQARGQRSADDASIAADEIVAGSFSNFSGTLTAIDSAAGTVTLKDLATKKAVTVGITGKTNLRKLPAGYGQSMPGRDGAAGSASSPTRGAGAAAAGQSSAGMRAPAETGSAGTGRTGKVDLSRVINRLPTETLGELKPGDAVMIVASNAPDSDRATAITLLSGVEQILSSSTAGQTTLSPWSLGSGEAEGGEAGGGAGGGR